VLAASLAVSSSHTQGVVIVMASAACSPTDDEDGVEGTTSVTSSMEQLRAVGSRIHTFNETVSYYESLLPSLNDVVGAVAKSFCRSLSARKSINFQHPYAAGYGDMGVGDIYELGKELEPGRSDLLPL
jgi:hypothetical protein